jgi:DNA-binding transcriptional LysR family regulator
VTLTNVGLRHLRAFVVLAEELHFARAAARLHLSQPALSQTIKQLERSTGLRLLQRTTRRVELTPEGRDFRDDAVRVLERFDALMAHARATAAGRRGTLRIGYTIGAAVDLVPRVLRAFARQCPDVHVETTEFDFSEPAAGLDDGRADVAVVRPPIEAGDVRLFALAREPRVACVPDSHPLAQRREISVEDVLEEPIVAAPGTGVWRDYWLCCEYRRGKPAPVVGEAATFEAELQAVASGVGISITAEAAARFYARPGLRFPRIADIPPCEVAVALPPDPTPAARLFAEVALATTEGIAAEPPSGSPAGER